MSEKKKKHSIIEHAREHDRIYTIRDMENMKAQTLKENQISSAVQLIKGNVVPDELRDSIAFMLSCRTPNIMHLCAEITGWSKEGEKQNPLSGLSDDELKAIKLLISEQSHCLTILSDPKIYESMYCDMDEEQERRKKLSKESKE